MIRKAIAVGCSALCLMASIAPAAAKKHHSRHLRPAYALPMPYERYGDAAGPHMIQVRPGLWISNWDCFTDEGQGRFKPCSTGRW